MSINAISMSGYSCGISGIDDEYQRIMRALRAYGIEPTGDKSVDSAKLKKIEASKDSQNTQFPESNENKDRSQNSISENQIVDKGVGTDQVAMLNKLKLGLM